MRKEIERKSFIMRPLKDYEDYFNERQTRNEENTEKKDYNCGGYALRTFSWYLPYEYDEKNYPFFSNSDLAEYLMDVGYSVEETMDEILRVNTEKMLKDFSGKLRVVQRYSHIENDEELIAYRLSFEVDDSCIDDMDFHFVVFRDGQWMSKMGADEVKLFAFTEEQWETPNFIYNSPIVYLAHKI